MQREERHEHTCPQRVSVRVRCRVHLQDRGGEHPPGQQHVHVHQQMPHRGGMHPGVQGCGVEQPQPADVQQPRHHRVRDHPHVRRGQHPGQPPRPRHGQAPQGHGHRRGQHQQQRGEHAQQQVPPHVGREVVVAEHPQRSHRHDAGHHPRGRAQGARVGPGAAPASSGADQRRIGDQEQQESAADDDAGQRERGARRLGAELRPDPAGVLMHGRPPGGSRAATPGCRSRGRRSQWPSTRGRTRGCRPRARTGRCPAAPWG